MWLPPRHGLFLLIFPRVFLTEWKCPRILLSCAFTGSTYTGPVGHTEMRLFTSSPVAALGLFSGLGPGIIESFTYLKIYIVI